MKLNLDIPQPSFDSNLVALLIELEAMRRNRFAIEYNSGLFYQLKNIFSMLESLQSARIEGNRTTISDYVSSKFEPETKNESIREIYNLEKSINYILENYINDENFKISTRLLKELHSIITKDLTQEGSNTPGAFRSGNVIIKNSAHIPPESIMVQEYMDKLVAWINKEDKIQHLLLKVALAHHAFAWIHPFDNGNGRMARLLTYTMLLQYGFRMSHLFNPSAIFCIKKQKYFDMLQLADQNTSESKLKWCEYVLSGLKSEMEKMMKLLDKGFLCSRIIIPAINRAQSLHYISDEQKKILELSLKKSDNLIKAKDVSEIFEDKTPRQINHILSKMLESGLLTRKEPNSRIYFINLESRDLSHGIIDSLYKEKLIDIRD